MEKHPYIIGMAGGSGSGKTTFLNQLRSHFEESELVLVSQDNYYRPREEQAIDDQGVINFDVPEALDLDKFHQDLQRLQKGEAIEQLEYTFNNNEAEATIIKLESAPVILAEGLFVFHKEEIRNLLDFSIYFFADPDIRLQRRIQRDAEERGYPESDVRYRWENHVRPADIQFLEPFEKDCDMIINNNRSFDVGLKHVVNLIKNQL